MQILNLPLHKIVVPTPFHVGPVNVYLITEPEVSLIDTGPSTPEARSALEEGLREIRLQVKDIRKIFITHGHPDHYGQAASLARESGATLLASTFDSPQFQHRVNQDFYVRAYQEAAVPQKIIDLFAEEFRSIQRTAEPIQEYAPVHEGDSLRCGSLEFKVISTPGHTPGSVCFHSQEQHLLIAADTVIKRITPNPVLDEDPARPGMRYPSLKNYLTSLERLHRWSPAFIFSGHGEEVDEFQLLFQKMVRHHEERQNKILNLLGRRPKSPWRLVRELFPDVSDDGMFLALSEVIAHVDLLESHSRVQSEIREGVRIIEAIEQ